MKNPIHISPRIRAELLSPAAEGGRHNQAVGLALKLLSSGLVPSAVGRQLRSMYATDVTDDELARIIQWAVGLITGHSPKAISPRSQMPAAGHSVTAPAILPVERVERFLGDFRVTEADFWEVSPWRPLEDWRVDGLMAMAALYYGGEFVNIIADYGTSEMDGKVKAHPSGAGIVMDRDAWMRQIRDEGAPESKAGAWLRMNPVLSPTPKNGRGFSDEDIAAYRYVLLESDILPAELQLSFFAKLRLPITMILSSGGKSFHAWLKVDAKDADQYRTAAKQIFARLKPFGFDDANKNPSRLSRMPGALRVIGAHGDGAQRLVYLNSDPKQGVSII